MGFEVSKELASLISEWQKEKDFCNLVRFVAPSDLHMTLVPPWYENNVEEVISLLSKTLSEQKFYPPEIRFGKIRVVPEHNIPRLLWLEGSRIVQLEVLRSKLLERFDIKEKRKDFIPHITLARFKRGNKTGNFSYLEDSFVFMEKFSEIAVFESRLLRSGASYTVVAKFKL